MRRMCFAHSKQAKKQQLHWADIAGTQWRIARSMSRWNDSFRISLAPEAHCSKTEMNYVFSCCCCRLLSQTTVPLCPYVLLCLRSSHFDVLMCSVFHLLFMFLCLHIAYNSVFVDIYAYLIAFNGQQEATRAHSQNLSKISIATTEYSYAENDRWIVVWIVTCVERVPAILTPLDYCWQRGSTHFALSRHKS